MNDTKLRVWEQISSFSGRKRTDDFEPVLVAVFHYEDGRGGKEIIKSVCRWYSGVGPGKGWEATFQGGHLDQKGGEAF